MTSVFVVVLLLSTPTPPQKKSAYEVLHQAS